MNCQEFRSLMPDEWDAVRARGHVAACPSCAAVVARHERLKAGLRAVAAETAGREADPRVEAVLLEAFRKQAAGRPASRRARVSAWWWAPAAAAAAVLVAAAVLSRSNDRVSPAPGAVPVRPSVTASAPPSGAEANSATSRAGAAATVAANAAGREQRPNAAAGSRGIRRSGAAGATAQSPRIARSAGRSARAPAVTSAATQRSAGVGYRAPLSAAPDSTSPQRSLSSVAAEDDEFIPLPYAAPVMGGEALDVIRVRLPRSAMMRFGVPVQAERAWEPVKADVVFGQDGVARAIRFVK